MILGLSVPTFTLIHVIISLVAIGAGVVVLLGMLANNRLPGWTALFLLTTAVTSITGFFFLGVQPKFGPPHVFGVVTLVVMVPVLLGRYASGMRGWWRPIYIAGALFVFWLNCRRCGHPVLPEILLPPTARADAERAAFRDHAGRRTRDRHRRRKSSR